MAEGEGTAARGGLLRSIRQLAGTLIGAAQTRLGILATELEEERLRLERMLLFALAAAFCTGMTVLLAVAFVVIYFWDTHRLLAVGGLAAGFLFVAAACALILRDVVRSRPKLFAVTRGELAKDQAMLREPRA
jgi:uncharacterized membrane protein YqjE